jgi:hypothetical protein
VHAVDHCGATTCAQDGVDMVDTRRAFPLVLLAAIAACGDDQDDLDSGPAADGAGSSSSVNDDTAGDDAGVDDAADDVDDDDDDEGGGTTAGGGGGGSGATEETGSEDADVACLPADVFEALQQHRLDLRAAAYVLAGVPSDDMRTGFLLAPGLPMPPAVPFMTQGGPLAACDEPVALPVVCDLGSCTMVQCTADGWITRLSIIPPIGSDGWIYTQAFVRTQWIAGETGTTFRISTTGFTPSGAEISLLGSGAMDVDSFSVDEEFPALHPAGPLFFTYSEGADGVVGALRIGEVVTAEVDATGQLQPTGECP